MSFPRYPKYKPSGVEWLGEVPEHWEVKKFRWLFRESSEKIESEIVGDMLSVSGYRGIEIKNYDDENRKRLDEELIGYRIVRPGQLVVNTMWLNYAGLGISDFEGHVSPAYRAYWPTPELHLRFAHYLLRSGTYVQGYTRLLTGIRPNSLQMSREDLMEFPVIIPPKSDQTAIASFLDRETAKIDALVEEQRGLIGLLKEKRQALISHAVTKGLNPKAKLKDSGIEWLGMVPEGWEVKKLSHAIMPGTTITYGIVQAGPHVEEGVPYIRTGDMSGDCLLDKEYPKTSAEIDRSYQRSKVFVGDIVIAIRATVGKALPVPRHLNGANLTQGTAKISPGTSVLRDFMLYLLAGDGSQTQFDLHAKGATFKEITLEALRNLMIILPPLSEQAAIVTFLDTETAKLDTLVAESEGVIALLQERRSALISAAVTGGIDVRNFAKCNPVTQ